MKLIPSIVTLILFLSPTPAYAVTLEAPDLSLTLTTDKIAVVSGPIYEYAGVKFQEDMAATKALPGPRLIILNSDGGMVKVGEHMLSIIEEERAAGTQIICFVDKKASSMAFNILTRCDLRIASQGAMMLVHKIRYVNGTPKPLTAKNMRDYADDLDRDDEPYRQANSKAMGITLEEYDSFADKETYWSAKKLLKQQYLHAIGTLKK